MPWILRVLLVILPAIFLAHTYVGSRVLDAVARLSDWPRSSLRGIVIALGIYLNLYPVLVFGAYFLKLDTLTRGIRGGSKVIDVLFTYPFWFGLILVLELVPLFLLMDALKLPLYPLYRRHRAEWLSIQARVVLALVFVFAVYVVARAYVDSTRVQINQTELRVPNLPAELDGLRLVHLSDLQADAHTDSVRMQSYINAANRLQPDLVCFTGDLVTSGDQHIEAGARMLGKLQAKYGVYACLGDHDYWSNLGAIIRRLRQQGVTVVEDSTCVIPIQSAKVALTLITNVYNQRPRPERLRRLVSELPDGALKIFVTHQPSQNIVDFASENGYQLFLAGHTHGGQIVFRPFGLRFTPGMIENRYLSGFYQAGSMRVSVNNGLGLTFAPLRYRAPAEVTLIRVVGLE